MPPINTHPDNKALRLAKLKVAQVMGKQAIFVQTLLDAQADNTNVTDAFIQQETNNALSTHYLPLFAEVRQAGGIVRDYHFGLDLRGVNAQTRQQIEAHLHHSFGAQVSVEFNPDPEVPTLSIKADLKVLNDLKSYCDNVIKRGYFAEALTPIDVEVNGLEDYSRAAAFIDAVEAEREAVRTQINTHLLDPCSA